MFQECPEKRKNTVKNSISTTKIFLKYLKSSKSNLPLYTFVFSITFMNSPVFIWFFNREQSGFLYQGNSLTFYEKEGADLHNILEMVKLQRWRRD